MCLSLCGIRTEELSGNQFGICYNTLIVRIEETTQVACWDGNQSVLGNLGTTSGGNRKISDTKTKMQIGTAPLKFVTKNRLLDR